MIVNKSLFPVKSGFSVISQMQQKMAELQTQLGSGQKASSLAGMGRDLPMSLSVRGRLDKIEGYSNNIDTINLRLSFLDNAMTRFDKIEGEARNSITPGDYGTNDITMATSPGLADARFDELVTMLNQDVAGRYLFGGNITDKPPLETAKVLLDGEGGRLGFKQILSDRLAADRGTNGLGRLVAPPVVPGSGTATLMEDGAHPFGYKLSTTSTSTSATPAISVTQPVGDPASLSVSFTAEPVPGQTVTLGFTLPDGTETQITLIATTDSPAAPGAFTINANMDVMATNFSIALQASIKENAAGELTAASTFSASEDFFAADGIPKVTTGTPATGLVDADPDKVVFWYHGQTSDDPRGSISARVDDAAQARYGMQATESGMLRLIRTQAAMAVTTYPSEADIRAKPENETLRLAAQALPEGAAKVAAEAQYEASVGLAYRESRGLFDGMASRQQSQMSEGHNAEAGSIERATMDLAVARMTTENATKRHTDYKGQLANLLSDVETVPQEETAMMILQLQTRMEASYQVTAMVSKLSLANYL